MTVAAPDQSTTSASLNRYKQTGAIEDLWPHLTRTALLEAHVQVAETVRQRLTRTDDSPSHLQTTTEEHARAVGCAAFLAGVGPLLGFWVEQGLLRTDPNVSAILGDHLVQGRRRQEMLGDNLVLLSQAMNRHGVVPTVLKGVFTARRYFPEPGVRPSADIDILVSREKTIAAEAALKECGYTSHQPEWIALSGQREWVHHDAPTEVASLELEHADNPWSIDLHPCLDRRYYFGRWARFGDLPTEMLSESNVGTAELSSLRQPLLVCHLAQHASVDPIRLIRLIELALVIRKDVATGQLTWEDLSHVLEETDLALFVYPALELTERLAPGTLDPDFRAELATTATRRAGLAVDQIENRKFEDWSGFSTDRKLMWARGPIELALSLAERVIGPDIRPGNYIRLQLRRLRSLR